MALTACRSPLKTEHYFTYEHGYNGLLKPGEIDRDNHNTLHTSMDMAACCLTAWFKTGLIQIAWHGMAWHGGMVLNGSARARSRIFKIDPHI